jgi:hypothetical protein
MNNSQENNKSTATFNSRVAANVPRIETHPRGYEYEVLSDTPRETVEGWKQHFKTIYDSVYADALKGRIHNSGATSQCPEDYAAECSTCTSKKYNNWEHDLIQKLIDRRSAPLEIIQGLRSHHTSPKNVDSGEDGLETTATKCPQCTKMIDNSGKVNLANAFDNLSEENE